MSAYAFDAYGARQGTDSSTDPYSGFGGQAGYYADWESGLSLLGQRYYDAGTGRFVTRDPIGQAGGLNVYAYCGNNPVNRSDPSGLDWNVGDYFLFSLADTGHGLNIGLWGAFNGVTFGHFRDRVPGKVEADLYFEGSTKLGNVEGGALAAAGVVYLAPAVVAQGQGLLNTLRLAGTKDYHDPTGLHHGNPQTTNNYFTTTCVVAMGRVPNVISVAVSV